MDKTALRSKLVDGLIPPKTECPFRKECILLDICKHMGTEHERPFSCAVARGFDLIQQKEG